MTKMWGFFKGSVKTVNSSRRRGRGGRRRSAGKAPARGNSHCCAGEKHLRVRTIASARSKAFGEEGDEGKARANGRHHKGERTYDFRTKDEIHGGKAIYTKGRGLRQLYELPVVMAEQ